MSNIINIAGQEIEQIIYKGEPVLTYKMIDDLHSRPDGTARKTFSNNKERFILNEDFFNIKYDEIGTFLNANNIHNQMIRSSINLFTQTGYLLFVKTFTDDKSWEIQKALIKCYFIVKKQGFNQAKYKEIENDYKMLRNQRLQLQEHDRFLDLVEVISRKIVNGEKSIEDYNSCPDMQEKIKEYIAIKKDILKSKTDVDYIFMFINECCYEDSKVTVAASNIYKAFSKWYLQKTKKKST